MPFAALTKAVQKYAAQTDIVIVLLIFFLFQVSALQEEFILIKFQISFSLFQNGIWNDANKALKIIGFLQLNLRFFFFIIKSTNYCCSDKSYRSLYFYSD